MFLVWCQKKNTDKEEEREEECEKGMRGREEAVEKERRKTDRVEYGKSIIWPTAYSPVTPHSRPPLSHAQSLELRCNVATCNMVRREGRERGISST